MLNILLINPPIHDFTAHDFWLKPYGLLGVAGRLRGRARMKLFDFMDRLDSRIPDGKSLKCDGWGRGQYWSRQIPKPAALRDIKRRWRRFGLPRGLFQSFLRTHPPFDAALIQTGMTYWYSGVQEVLEDLREYSSGTKTILGGVYATLCPDHAGSLGADLVISGVDLTPVWKFLGLKPDDAAPPFWEAYRELRSGVMTLTSGCPFRCTYCSVPTVYPSFSCKPGGEALEEFELLRHLGVRDIAFYDDALLHRSDLALIPFLEKIIEGPEIRFHTPNGLNVRFLDDETARLMARAGFTSFFLGYESLSRDWQDATGGKALPGELERAVSSLTRAGVPHQHITAYLMIGHPGTDLRDLEDSMGHAHRLGIRVMLSEFSPIPGTPDSGTTTSGIDLSEPLNQNKTAWTVRVLGHGEVARLKTRCHQLNRMIGIPDQGPPLMT